MDELSNCSIDALRWSEIKWWWCMDGEWGISNRLGDGFVSGWGLDFSFDALQWKEAKVMKWWVWVSNCSRRGRVKRHSVSGEVRWNAVQFPAYFSLVVVVRESWRCLAVEASTRLFFGKTKRCHVLWFGPVYGPLGLIFCLSFVFGTLSIDFLFCVWASVLL